MKEKILHSIVPCLAELQMYVRLLMSPAEDVLVEIGARTFDIGLELSAIDDAMAIVRGYDHTFTSTVSPRGCLVWHLGQMYCLSSTLIIAPGSGVQPQAHFVKSGLVPVSSSMFFC